MKLLSAALLIVGMLENEADYRLACEALIATNAHVVAIVINHHAGWRDAAFQSVPRLHGKLCRNDQCARKKQRGAAASI